MYNLFDYWFVLSEVCCITPLLCSGPLDTLTFECSVYLNGGTKIDIRFKAPDGYYREEIKEEDGFSSVEKRFYLNLNDEWIQIEKNEKVKLKSLKVYHFLIDEITEFANAVIETKKYLNERKSRHPKYSS